MIAHSVLDRLAIRRPHARKANYILTRSRRLATAPQSASRNNNVALFGDAAFIVDRDPD
jgi:hypothetical protein